MIVSKFDIYFDEPVFFSNGCHVISGKLSKEEAAKRFSDYTGEEIDPEFLTSDRVRFGFPPDDVEDREELGACWFSGAGSGKGTQPIWVME